MKSTRKGFKIPRALKIGERFTLAFQDHDLSKFPHQGRLQDLSPEYLCIDAPAELRPPRGTPVTISSLRNSAEEYTFSSKILGNSCLNGNLPVLLLKTPDTIKHKQRRSSFRVSVTLRARVEWEEIDKPGEFFEKPGVFTNMSGGGGQLFLRQNPATEKLDISIVPADGFVEEWARRQRANLSAKRPFIRRDPYAEACKKIRAQFRSINARIVNSKIHTEDARGPIFALSIAFVKPQENCYRLVRYHERQTLQKGAFSSPHPVITAA
ncbi:MAG: hypothetical protein CME16_01450 [Gemmatimonadetes bacterium]|nr:hypothetical protein [Gemmatimonadota bacterium]